MSLRQMAAMFVLVAIGIPIAHAQAKLPRSKSHTIVPGKSIGGVKIGAKYKTVQQKWGRNKSCNGKYVFTCAYNGSIKEGTANVIQTGNRIRSMQISLGADAMSLPVFSSPLMKYKTNQGIGLGSTEAEVRAAYPAATNTAADALAIVNGKVKTHFSLYAGRVEDITIAP